MYNSSIMTAIGSGNTRFSAIADKIGRKTTEISVPLKNLQEMSYVEKKCRLERMGRRPARPSIGFPIRSCAQAVSLRNLFGKDWGMASRWWGSVPVRNEKDKVTGGEVIELDVVAESEDKKSLLIGECKWNALDFADRLLRVMKAKVASIPQFSKYDVEYVLFLRERPIDADALDSLCVHVLYPEDVISLL